MDTVNFTDTVSLVSTIFSYNIAQLTIRAASHYRVDVVYCYRRSSVVCPSVGWYVTILSPANAAELIKIPFWMWARVYPRNHALDGSPDPSMRMGNLDGEKVIRMADGRLKERDHQFFYIRIRDLEKRRTKCVLVAGNYVEKRQHMMYISCD